MSKPVWRVQFGRPSPGWRKAKILLPHEADLWDRRSRRMFRFFMRRKGWVWLGSLNRRKMRGSSSWSQHSWVGQAHDFAPRGATRREKQRRGDRAVRRARARWPRAFLFIWNQKGSRALHRDGNPIHVHAEGRPKKTGTPP